MDARGGVTVLHASRICRALDERGWVTYKRYSEGHKLLLTSVGRAVIDAEDEEAK